MAVVELEFHIEADSPTAVAVEANGFLQKIWPGDKVVKFEKAKIEMESPSGLWLGVFRLYVPDDWKWLEEDSG